MKTISEFAFEFYGETFQIYLADDRKWYVPVRKICDAMGLSFAPQYRRILEDDVFDGHIATFRATSDYKGSERIQEMFCLSINRLPFWLATVDHKRVKPEIREKVRQYRNEMADALYAFMRSDMFPKDILAETDTYLPEGEQAFHAAMDEARAAKRLADTIETYISSSRQSQADLDEKLAEIRTMIGRLVMYAPGDKIIAPQRSHIMRMVKEFAKEYKTLYETTYNYSMGMCMAKAYTSLFDHLHVTRYEDIRISQVTEAVQFLAALWTKEIAHRGGPAVPAWFYNPVDQPII